MITFFAILFPALIVLMIIGLFKPSFALPSFLAFSFLPSSILDRIRSLTERPTRLKVIGSYLAAIFVAFVMMGIAGTVTEEAKTSTKYSTSKKVPPSASLQKIESASRSSAAAKPRREQFIEPCAGNGMLAVDTIIQKRNGDSIAPMLAKADRFARDFPDVESAIREQYYKTIKATYNADVSGLYGKVGDGRTQYSEQLKVLVAIECMKGLGFD